MTDMKQPEALRLIAEWRNSMPIGVMRIWAADVRDELRRQHAEIESLRAKLDELAKQEPVGWQRRVKFPRFPGEIALWEQCSKHEATSYFEKSPAREYRAVYLAAGARPVEPAPTAQDDEKDAARLYPVVIDGLLWLCTKRGGTFKPVDDCAAVNPPLSWKNALAADKKEPTNGND